MWYARRIGAFRGVPWREVPLFGRMPHLVGRQWGQRLAWEYAPGSEEIFKSLTRENEIPMNGTGSGVGYGHSGLSRYEHNRMRTCHASLVSNRHRGTAFFKNYHFFRVVVHVERDRCPRIHDFSSHLKVLGSSIALVNLDEEFRHRS